MFLGDTRGVLSQIPGMSSGMSTSATPPNRKWPLTPLPASHASVYLSITCEALPLHKQKLDLLPLKAQPWSEIRISKMGQKGH